MSPSDYDSSWARVFYVSPSGFLGGDRVNDAIGVRPVINLSADVTITGGNGSSSTPFDIAA